MKVSELIILLQKELNSNGDANLQIDITDDYSRYGTSSIKKENLSMQYEKEETEVLHPHPAYLTLIFN